MTLIPYFLNSFNSFNSSIAWRRVIAGIIFIHISPAAAITIINNPEFQALGGRDKGGVRGAAPPATQEFQAGRAKRSGGARRGRRPRQRGVRGGSAPPPQSINTTTTTTTTTTDYIN